MAGAVLDEYREAVALNDIATPGRCPRATCSRSRAARRRDGLLLHGGPDDHPAGATAELTWTGVYEKLLRRPGDPAADVFLLGFDTEPIRAERDYDLARWIDGVDSLAAVIADPAVDALAPVPPQGVGRLRLGNPGTSGSLHTWPRMATRCTTWTSSTRWQPTIRQRSCSH